MQFSSFKSLGAKLFYLMTALVLLTVAGNSWQFFRTFRNYQIQQLQDSLQEQSERVKDQVEAVLETWRAQIAVALPTLRLGDEAAQQQALQQFVDANPDFIELELLSAPDAKSVELTKLGSALTSHRSDKNFGDKDAVRTGQELLFFGEAWLKSQILKLKKRNFAIDSAARATNLPIVTLATRFEVAGSGDVVWAVVHAWQSPLLKTLVKSTFLSSVLVDNKGRVFSSLDSRELLGRPMYTSHALVKSALSAVNPSGFENEFKDGKGRARVGAFARLQHYDLAVLVEQDAGVAGLVVKKTLLATSLWAGLFVLVAILFSFLGSSGITKGLRAVAYGTERIAAGDLTYQVPMTSGDEVGALGQAVNHMAGKITGLMRTQVENARFEKELETAKMVQSTFFPKAEIRRPALEVFGFYQPASECGGDLWGHFTVAEGLEFVFIADAMGHGAPAALVTAMAYSTTMTIADVVKHDATYRDSPAALLSRLNRIIYEAVRGTISMTFFAALIDTRTGRLTYANAGHNFPVLLPVDAADSRLGSAAKKGAKLGKGGGPQPISLKLMGNPLGIEAHVEFKEQSIELRAGDKIVFFTDGLIECTSPKGEAIGRKKFLTQVSLATGDSAATLRDSLVKDAFQFFAGHPIADDITVVVAELARDWQAQPEAVPAAALPASAVVAKTHLPVSELPAVADLAQASQVPQASESSQASEWTAAAELALVSELSPASDVALVLPPLDEMQFVVATIEAFALPEPSALPDLTDAERVAETLLDIAATSPSLEPELPSIPHSVAPVTPSVAQISASIAAGTVPSTATSSVSDAAPSTVIAPAVATVTTSVAAAPARPVANGKFRLKLPSAG